MGGGFSLALVWWFTQGWAVTLAFLSAAVSNKYFQRMPNASQFLCGSLRSNFHTKTSCAFVTAEVGVSWHLKFGEYMNIDSNEKKLSF